MPSELPEPRLQRTHAFSLITRVLFSLVVFIALGFTILFSYYLWIQTYGDRGTQQKLTEEFQPTLTVAPGLARLAQSETVGIDPEGIVRGHNPVIGNSQANLTIIAFIDFECPFCREAFSPFEELINTYHSAVRIVFKHFPVESIHPHANHAALGAACANEQEAFWEYYRLLFETQTLDDLSLVAHAKTLGLDTNAFTQCLTSERYSADIDEDIEDGIMVGVRGTPTYIVGKKKIEGLTTREVWDRAIIDALK